MKPGLLTNQTPLLHSCAYRVLQRKSWKVQGRNVFRQLHKYKTRKISLAKNILNYQHASTWKIINAQQVSHAPAVSAHAYSPGPRVQGSSSCPHGSSGSSSTESAGTHGTDGRHCWRCRYRLRRGSRREQRSVRRLREQQPGGGAPGPGPPCTVRSGGTGEVQPLQARAAAVPGLRSGPVRHRPVRRIQRGFAAVQAQLRPAALTE